MPILFWYKKFVRPSDGNRKKYNRTIYLIENYNSKINSSISKNNSTRQKILFLLGFKKQLSWSNIRDIKLKELNIHLKEDSHVKFDDKITHIVLEDGDVLRKNSSLKENFKLVFNNNLDRFGKDLFNTETFTDKFHPLFPTLIPYEENNENLTKHRGYMLSLLEDRKKLLDHASTTTTNIYIHPNFELAMQYVNQVPKYGFV